MRREQKSDEKELQAKAKTFDLTVTHRDEKSGMITHRTPYILRISGEQGSDVRTRLWERPAGSGNLFNKSNEPIGRWIYEDKVVKGKKIRVGKYDATAEHISWTPPQTEDQKIATENAALRAELEQLKAEAAKRNADSAPAKKKDQGA